MRLLKILLGLLVLSVIGAIIAGVSKAVRGGSKGAPSTLSYDSWPTVPRKPATNGAA
ncbi:MAG: hypothetical protein WCG62_04925 [Actinomycetes bacterium]